MIEGTGGDAAGKTGVKPEKEMLPAAYAMLTLYESSRVLIIGHTFS